MFDWIRYQIGRLTARGARGARGAAPPPESVARRIIGLVAGIDETLIGDAVERHLETRITETEAATLSLSFAALVEAIDLATDERKADTFSLPDESVSTRYVARFIVQLADLDDELVARMIESEAKQNCIDEHAGAVESESGDRLSVLSGLQEAIAVARDARDRYARGIAS